MENAGRSNTQCFIHLPKEFIFPGSRENIMLRLNIELVALRFGFHRFYIIRALALQLVAGVHE